MNCLRCQHVTRKPAVKRSAPVKKTAAPRKPRKVAAPRKPAKKRVQLDVIPTAFQEIMYARV